MISKKKKTPIENHQVSQETTTTFLLPCSSTLVSWPRSWSSTEKPLRLLEVLLWATRFKLTCYGADNTPAACTFARKYPGWRCTLWSSGTRSTWYKGPWCWLRKSFWSEEAKNRQTIPENQTLTHWATHISQEKVVASFDFVLNVQIVDKLQLLGLNHPTSDFEFIDLESNTHSSLSFLPQPIPLSLARGLLLWTSR